MHTDRDAKTDKTNKMKRYIIKEIQDITQPLYKHKYIATPKVLKAIVKGDNGMKIMYIETEGVSIGKGTVFVAKEDQKIVRPSQIKIEKQTEYVVDKKMVMNLLEAEKKKQTQT